MADSIRVDTSVKAADKASAATIITKLTTDSINRGLTTAGLPPATVLEVSAGSARGSAVAGIIGGVVGAVMVIILAGGAFLFQRRTRQREAPNVTDDFASVELGHATSLSNTADGACLCCIRILLGMVSLLCTSLQVL